MFAELRLGNKREADLVARGKVRGQETFFLFHLEHQAQPQTEFPRRMFRYFSILHERYDLPVYPVALFSYPAPRKKAASSYQVRCLGSQILSFHYRVIQLNRLEWRDFVKRENPVAVALMSRMRISKRDRVKVKLACLRLLGRLGLDHSRIRFVSAFVDQYLALTTGESVEFSEELDKIEPKERNTMIELTTSWKEEGRKEGLEEGRRELLQVMLESRFGDLPPDVQEKLAQLDDPDEVRTLARLAAKTDSVEEFRSGLEGRH